MAQDTLQKFYKHFFAVECSFLKASKMGWYSFPDKTGRGKSHKYAKLFLHIPAEKQAFHFIFIFILAEGKSHKYAKLFPAYTCRKAGLPFYFYFYFGGREKP